MGGKLRIAPILLGLICGWGHLWEGRDARGLLLFSLFAVGIFGILNGALLVEGPEGGVIVGLSTALAATAWIFGLIDIVRLTYEPRVARRRAEHLRRHRAAIACYLRDDLARAARLLRENLRDDPRDVEALARLATICRERGDTRAARRLLVRLRRADLEGKWRWEAEGEAARLGEARRSVVSVGGAR